MGGSWKGALGCLRTLRAAAAELVERHWEDLKFLAYDLETRRLLDQRRIAQLLNH